ncbi:MAG TPA: rhodanese-like domain-containing protein [Rhizomicrobium sp.]|jgi:rhodanese-related sulfurtransferase|nr:rhodanese-like domain-containing protein [Rhizomicrobium sp.]
MRTLRLAVISIFPLFLWATLAVCSGNPIGSAQTKILSTALIQPGALADALSSGQAKPVIFQVGFAVLYTEAHIPGAQYAGPTSQVDGADNLRKHAQGLSRGQPIVIYCGCCPWFHCPNVGPAFEQLRAMGFTEVKVLYIANNFGDDWVARGYPVERGK